MSPQDERALHKFVRRCRCLRKFPAGRVYRGRGKADAKRDAMTLDSLRLAARSIGEEIRRMVAEIIAAERELI